MFRSIHLYPRFDKQLNALKRGDRKAARAAETGERLVDALTRGLPTINPADPVSFIDQKTLRRVFSGLCEGVRR